jgi:hypothetical protein
LIVIDSANLRGRPLSCTSTETPPKCSVPMGSKASGSGFSGGGGSERGNKELSSSNSTSAAAVDFVFDIFCYSWHSGTTYIVDLDIKYVPFVGRAGQWRSLL